MALGKTVARLRVVWLDSSSPQPDQGREKEGEREDDARPCGVPAVHPASLLVIHGRGFLWIKSPSPPLPGCSFIAESPTLHAISRLSAFAPAAPSAKCLLHCPGLATTSSFFRPGSPPPQPPQRPQLLSLVPASSVSQPCTSPPLWLVPLVVPAPQPTSFRLVLINIGWVRKRSFARTLTGWSGIWSLRAEALPS